MPPMDALQAADPPPALRGGPARTTPPTAVSAPGLADGFAGQLAQALAQGSNNPQPGEPGQAAPQPAAAQADAAPGGPLPPPLIQPGVLPASPAPDAARPSPAAPARAAVADEALAPSADTGPPAEQPATGSPSVSPPPLIALPEAVLPKPITPPEQRSGLANAQDAAPLSPAQDRGRLPTPMGSPDPSGAADTEAAAPPGVAQAHQTHQAWVEASPQSSQLPAAEAFTAVPVAPTPQHAASPPTSPAAPFPGPSPAAPSPAGQVAPALVAPVLIAIAAPGQPGAPQLLTIRLDPAELGRVQVRIERTDDGPVKVELAVERTDTLLLLLRDQPQLQRALDLAGVPPDGRTLHLSLAAERAPMDAGASFAGGAGPGGGGHRPGQGHAQTGSGSGRDTPEPHPTARLRPTWGRAGLDITA